MLFRNVTLGDLEHAARLTGVRLVQGASKGRALRATLALEKDDSPAWWQRRSHHGRRVNAVCWHGYAAFLARLFLDCPGAHTWGGRGVEWSYKGAADFLAKYDATGDANIGSMMEPMAYRDACDCDYADHARAQRLIETLAAATTATPDR